MPRIGLEDMLRSQAITPEQDGLINWFYSQFDNSASANHRVNNVETLYFGGAIAGSEFETYAATKLYLCWSLYVSTLVIDSVPRPSITLYNEANAVSLECSNDESHFDLGGGGHQFQGNPILINNLYFSRLAVIDYTHIIYKGFRITLI